MFNTYLKNFSERERSTLLIKLQEDEKCDAYAYLGAFYNALQSTLELVKKIIHGNATYGESVLNHCLNLSEINIDVEFQYLLECPQLAPCEYDSSGLEGMKCLLKLMQFESRYFDQIMKVCDQYHLEGCLQDSNLQEVKKIVEGIRTQEALHQQTAIGAKKQWDHLSTILNIAGTNLECLELFKKMADCVEFYQFLEENNFVGSNSTENFRKQLDLISQQLEIEMSEHDVMVMNHLYASISFIAPFLDQSQDYSSLMAAVTSLDTATGLAQLDTVRSNMHLIHVWFSKSQVKTVFSKK